MTAGGMGLSMVLAAAVSLTACKGEDGATSKAGPTVTAGDTATSGDTATAGDTAKPAISSDGIAQQNSPDSLKSVVEMLVKAVAEQDPKAMGALLTGLTPDEATVKKALRDDVSAEQVSKVVASAKGLPTIEPGNTVVEVHGATAKEIYEQEVVESAHFSGNDQNAAREVLRPDMTYYKVTVAAPGAAAGNSLGLFFWDGAHWRRLGRVRVD